MIFQNCRKSHCRISQFPILFLPSYRNYTLSLPPLISINFHRNRNNCWESSSFENSSRSRFFIFLFHFISRNIVFTISKARKMVTRDEEESREEDERVQMVRTLFIIVRPRRGNFLEWTRGTRIEREPADNIWYFRCKRPRVPTFSRREQGRGPSKPRKPSSTSVKGFQQHPRPRVGHRSLPRIAELETRMRLQGLRFLERWKGLFRIWEERIRGLDRGIARLDQLDCILLFNHDELVFHLRFAVYNKSHSSIISYRNMTKVFLIRKSNCASFIWK